MTIDRACFPHINLDESSIRPGVDGPRYVEVPSMPGRLGDTNKGLVVYPQSRREAVVDYSDDNTLHQDQLSIVNG
jgi:hypothetical protein